MDRLTPVPPAPTSAMSGFTLTELAIVLFVVSLMLGGMLMPLSAQRDVRSRGETDKALNETRDSLLGYVVINGRFPCPDTDADGLENMTGSACTQLGGEFPFATVGTPPADGYGYRFRYRVAAAFTGTFTTLTSGDITVVSRGDNPATSGTTEAKAENTLVSNAPVVIFSVGKNGKGGLLHESGSRIPNPAAGTDEYLNLGLDSNDANNKKKISRTTTAGGGGCNDSTEGSSFCEFDDLVAWIPTTTIINRMVSAGRLP